MATLLEANEVTKIYAKGQRPSLNKVSFNVAESEFIAIMGASGSGKTTLLNVLSTIDTPTSGSIVINGVNLKQLSDTGSADFRRDNLGFIFQEYFLLDSLTIRENISVPLTLQKLPHKKIEKMVEQGRSSEASLYESRALVAEDEMNVTQSENNLLLSLVDLSQLLNLEKAEGFDIEEPDMNSVTLQQTASLVSPKDAFKFSVENRPGIKSALYALESSRFGLKQARSGYYPTLSFGASYGTSYYHAYKGGDENNWTFAEQMRNNGSETLGFTLSVPLFNRLVTRNQVKQARLQIRLQELALDNARQQLYKEIEQAYYAAVAAHKKYISSQKSVDAARISFEYEQKKYDAGKSTVFEYSDAKNKYEKSLSEQVQARYDFLFRSKVLDFYNGKPLAF